MFINTYFSKRFITDKNDTDSSTYRCLVCEKKGKKRRGGPVLIKRMVVVDPSFHITTRNKIKTTGLPSL
jgi:hypothetical protein